MRRARLFPQDFPRAQEFCIQLVGFLEEKSILRLLQQPHRHLDTRPCLCPGLPMAAQPQLLGAGIVVTWYISDLSTLAHAFWQLRAHPCASQSLKGFVASHSLHLKRDPLTSMLRASSCASLPGTGVPGMASTCSWCSQLRLHSGTEPRQGKQLACTQPPARAQGLLLAHWLPLLGGLRLAFLFRGLSSILSSCQPCSHPSLPLLPWSPFLLSSRSPPPTDAFHAGDTASQGRERCGLAFCQGIN